ncbi:MAG: 5'-methylthioadenosine/S-adenosylhomocysteine nucleosidase [Acinetobacter bereziniae]|uniref:5'-methylthioadenosine/S-adenosylhomocysteine nucleosidase n=1 Tax=Acinetobacter bereziniae TaxID=106648 RepID=A0A833PAV1_ACIBZ|nr:MAG: 5'-methylthioadenosine/S-adenosylhomocysteine nucleosidase [Acinetobacter bereziniae]
MQFKKMIHVLGMCSSLLLAACNNDSNNTSENTVAPKTLQPIVIQGALPVESEQMAAKLSNTTVETVGGWKFWKGTYQGYPVIISKTRMGMSNAAAATAIAIERYKPIAILTSSPT